MKTVIQMVREAGFAIDVNNNPNSPPSWWGGGHDNRFNALVALVRADERVKLAERPAQQEPVGTYGEIFESMRSLLRSGRQADQQVYMAMRDKLLYTTPQPAQQSCYCLNCEELSKQVTALKLCVEVERGFNAQEQPAQQEPVGAIILGGVIDTSDGPEYEEWEVEWNHKAIEAMQERLVTDNPVTLNIYTAPQPAQRTWAVLTDEECKKFLGGDAYGATIHDIRAIEAKLKEKNT